MRETVIFSRIENPYIHSSRIANPTERQNRCLRRNEVNDGEGWAVSPLWKQRGGKRAELERAPCARWVKGEGFFLFSDFGFWWAANKALATMHNRKAASASSTNKRVAVVY